MDSDDLTLMLQVKQGDHSAFKELVEKHKLSILNLCLRFTSNKEDAEDLAQEVFIRIFQAAPRYEAKSSFKTWFYRIAINLCINHQRRKKLLRFFSIDSNHKNDPDFREKIQNITDTEQPDINFEQREKQKIVQQAIESLPENQQAVVILYRYNNLSYKEIADILDTSVSAVESRLHRAKLNLKNKLAPLIKTKLLEL